MWPTRQGGPVTLTWSFYTIEQEMGWLQIQPIFLLLGPSLFALMLWTWIPLAGYFVIFWISNLQSRTDSVPYAALSNTMSIQDNGSPSPDNSTKCVRCWTNDCAGKAWLKATAPVFIYFVKLSDFIIPHDQNDLTVLLDLLKGLAYGWRSGILSVFL